MSQHFISLKIEFDALIEQEIAEHSKEIDEVKFAMKIEKYHVIN